MDELVQWFGQQLDEDERIAKAAAGLQADPENGWGVSGRAVTPHIAVVHEDEARAHIAAHDPARVLREIDAKRRILVEHALNGWVCTTCDNGEVEQVFPCPTLRLLALPYADRPGYREEWRP